MARWFIRARKKPSRKKPSGAHRDALARAKNNNWPTSPIQPGTVGRPKGVSERRQKLRLQLHRDLAWLGLPYKPDLYSFLAENLKDPDWRAQYEWPPGCPPGCPKVYRTIDTRHFRREIAFVHQIIWGKKGKREGRSLWQHWRHQDYRLTRMTP